jgi:signal transduction histidine kinase
MSTIVQRADRIDDAGSGVSVAGAPGATKAIAVLVAIAAVVVGVAGARSHDDALAYTGAALVAAWALATVIAAFSRPQETLSLWMAIATLAGAVTLTSDRLVGLLPYALAALAVTLPTGAIAGRRRTNTRAFLIAVAVLGLPFVVVLASSTDPMTGVIAIESVVLGIIALSAYVVRCRDASAIDRARLQWVGWGVVVSAALALVVWLMHVLVGWPDDVGEVAAIATVFVPLALALSSIERLALHIDRLLVRTIEFGGLVVLVGVVYVVVVLGFGETPTDASRRTLGLSIVAAAIAALLFVPARNRLEEIANRRVYGDRQAPDEPIQTFGARMSRSIPLDELLLQLAESLKKSMQLAAAEVWTGTGGLLERAAAVPYRDEERVKLREEEVAVVARAHAQGNAWIQVWLRPFIDQHPGRTLRIAPLVHSGELLGLVVCARTTDQQPFTDEEERVLTELARQVALALHNSALDTALQASLDELRIANEELRASRARIVATADQSRRQIERNLHDGAQQHLVALAVKLGLARQLVDGDPEALSALLEELRGDAQTTLTELRELAHGIYPPLLMDRGLPEALRAAANRSVLAADVDAEVGRYPAEVEAAVYFCCLEAMQNAGKHAGEGSRLAISVAADDLELRFSVADNGAGFDTSSAAVRGHGFVNMTDRLGAIGGVLAVESAPGQGSTIKGSIPLAVAAEPRPGSPPEA